MTKEELIENVVKTARVGSNVEKLDLVERLISLKGKEETPVSDDVIEIWVQALNISLL